VKYHNRNFLAADYAVKLTKVFHQSLTYYTLKNYQNVLKKSKVLFVQQSTDKTYDKLVDNTVTYEVHFTLFSFCGKINILFLYCATECALKHEYNTSNKKQDSVT